MHETGPATKLDGLARSRYGLRSATVQQFSYGSTAQRLLLFWFPVRHDLRGS